MRASPAPHPDVAPLSFLIGRWRGSGVGGYPGTESFHFEIELLVGSDGRPVLTHTTRSWVIDSATAERVRPAGGELGFWRPGAQGQVELLLAHATGFVEVWLGTARGLTAQLATDLVARTATAKELTAGRRAYGVVDGDLLFSYEMAAVGQSLQPHLSARLRRVPA